MRVWLLVSPLSPFVFLLFPMDAQWMLNGCSMDAQWMLKGCAMDSQMVLKGCMLQYSPLVMPLSACYDFALPTLPD
jgi:hypothetical protein